MNLRIIRLVEVVYGGSDALHWIGIGSVNICHRCNRYPLDFRNG